MTDIADFEASDPFSFADDDIEAQGSGFDDKKQSAVIDDNQGDPVAASEKTFGETREIRSAYKCGSVAGVSDKTIVLGGAGTGGVVATGITVRYNNNGHCDIEVTGHKHTGTTNHSAKNAYTVTLPTIGFGVIDPIGNPASTAAQSASWSASILKHVDRSDNQGEHLLGVSRGCRIEASATYLGTAPTPATAWTKDAGGGNDANSDLDMATLNVHKFQAPDAE